MNKLVRKKTKRKKKLDTSKFLFYKFIHKVPKLQVDDEDYDFESSKQGDNNKSKTCQKMIKNNIYYDKPILAISEKSASHFSSENEEGDDMVSALPDNNDQNSKLWLDLIFKGQ